MLVPAVKAMLLLAGLYCMFQGCVGASLVYPWCLSQSLEHTGCQKNTSHTMFSLRPTALPGECKTTFTFDAKVDLAHLNVNSILQIQGPPDYIKDII